MIRDLQTLLGRVDPHRMRELLLDFANIESPPHRTANAAEWYAGCLRASGAVETRLIRDWPEAPCVAGGFPGIRRSPILEFDGHLDTLPLAPVRASFESGRIYGRGVASGKGGLIAAAEASRVLSEWGPLPGGGVLVVAHSRFVAPEGDGEDLVHLIERGVVGNAVVLTYGEHAVAPLSGLGLGIFRILFSTPTRHLPEQHDVKPAFRSRGGTVLDAAHLFQRLLHRRSATLARESGRLLIAESAWVSRIDGGEPSNPAPATCLVEGNWRWIAERTAWDVHTELEALANKAAAAFGMHATVTLRPVRDGYRLAPGEQVVRSLRTAYRQVVGKELPVGGTSLVSDTAIFMRNARVPAICHGVDPRSAHLDNESVSLEELVRLVHVYLCLTLDYLSATSTVPSAREQPWRMESPVAAGQHATSTPGLEPAPRGTRW